MPDDSPRIACLVARANEVVTHHLLRGAQDEFAAYGFAAEAFEVLWVPGSAELPLAAQAAAESGKYDAVLCLGAIIRGETDHHEHLARAVFDSLQRVALEQDLPVALGVITADSLIQALDRAGGKHGNAGRTAVAAALEMLEVLSRIEAADARLPLDALDLPPEAAAALTEAGIATVGALCARSEAELRRLLGNGRSGLGEVLARLDAMGLSLAGAPRGDGGGEVNG